MILKDMKDGPLVIAHLHAKAGGQFWWIGDVHVHPDLRRQGIASGLIEAATRHFGMSVGGPFSVFTPDGRALFDAVKTTSHSTSKKISIKPS